MINKLKWRLDTLYRAGWRIYLKTDFEDLQISEIRELMDAQDCVVEEDAIWDDYIYIRDKKLYEK